MGKISSKICQCIYSEVCTFECAVRLQIFSAHVDADFLKKFRKVVNNWVKYWMVWYSSISLHYQNFTEFGILQICTWRCRFSKKQIPSAGTELCKVLQNCGSLRAVVAHYWITLGDGIQGWIKFTVFNCYFLVILWITSYVKNIQICEIALLEQYCLS